MKNFTPASCFFLVPVFFLSFFAQAQSPNLVINPSFESYTYPPVRSWPTVTEPGEQILNGWVTPTKGTADYYNSDLSVCDGFAIAKARTGEGRCAFIGGMGTQMQGVMNYKEYVQGHFKAPLQAGEKYCVKFYVALDRASPFTTAGIGAYISAEDIHINTKNPLRVRPQILSNQLITSEDGWTLISGTYVASGGESFITIGSFSDTSVVRLEDIGKNSERATSSSHILRSAYFYLDDVSVQADDGQVCDCTAKKANERAGDYYLFLLDISGSMNKSGKLALMKKEIVRFTQGLNENNRIGVMAFSDNAKILLPFSGPLDSVRIDSVVNNLKSHGTTNGDFAIHRVAEIIDSMHLPQRCHVLIATDGIFTLSEKTKSFADSVLTKNNTSFCVLQFGNITNDGLVEITQQTPASSYNYANKRNVPKILDEQLPEPEPDPSTVFYTQMAGAVGSEVLDQLLKDLSH